MALVLLLQLPTAEISFGQTLTQTIRGNILDADNKQAMVGATIRIVGSDPIIGTTANANGHFRLEKVGIGRISLQFSSIGYQTITIPNIVVNSAKEVVLEIAMQELAVKVNEVVVSGKRNKGQVTNDMSLISARSISPEETNRYPGGFNDPSRILSNFAGITSTQDGSNDIIVRGNSPKYVQWRLEGMQISNPNHFADQSSAGGSISTLNNNILATSDFYTGAFSPEFGDALSGVYDLKLRAGNNEKFESVFSLGLLGTDLTFEGPFKKGYAGSFLVNYRYSTISLIDKLGLTGGIGGIPRFQDAAFKVVLPSQKFGEFSVFGLGGISDFLFKNVKPSVWSTPGENGMKGDIKEDYNKVAHLSNLGFNHSISLGENSFLKTSIGYSNEGINDDVFESKFIKIQGPGGEFLRDSTVSKQLNFNSRLTKSILRAGTTFNQKLGSKDKIQLGIRYSVFNFEMNQSNLEENSSQRFSLVDMDNGIGTMNSFISWKHRISDNISFVTGLHNMSVLYNSKNSLEPRFALNWQVRNTQTFSLGYGKHSTMESVHNYFAKVKQKDGRVTEPNKNLDLLKAHHFVLGYEKRITENLRLKLEAYYQHLYNLPVENLDTSYYSTINEGLEFRYVNLVNKGTGKNYGLEVTLERFFNNNYYYLINASVYESKYKTLEGVERNTQFNGQYLVNIIAGKEFVRLGPKQNRTIGINAKVFFGGGRKIIPLLRDGQGNLSVDPANNQFWDYAKAYNRSIEDVYQITASVSYKFNRKKTTHEIFLNLDNLTSTKGKLSEFYDESQPTNVGYSTQFGFFPNLLYRVYF